MIGVPEVRITGAVTMVRWDRSPELTACSLRAIAKCISDNLPGSPAESQPYPDFIGLFRYKRPEFIELQGIRVRLMWIRIG